MTLRIKTLNGIGVLQRRRCLFFWATIRYGAPYALTAKAIHLSK